MRWMMIVMMALVATGAQAHVGHLAEVAGHGHWIGAAAIGLAVIVGVLGGRKLEPVEAGHDPETTDEEAAA